ncbi:hypothetical protein [Couchioplanes caeruleus]|uniref:Uncharacterized protein n=2 Tax=Couchioplanes caeruleus TaxID=56438 RepID=A0A1K0FKT0_9ACTN|nr:hypothetical protein [Couchioplanes caeruleus]OJF13461.1 hypothetical protein BG844_15075 [Couchioplanes caeruleus subsp. caeruleus]
MPRSGDVVYLGLAANVQFGGNRGFYFRVIRVHDWTTYEGWMWLDGYQLSQGGEAVERRSVFVQIAGLRPAPQVPACTAPPTGERAPLGSARPLRRGRHERR